MEPWRRNPEKSIRRALRLVFDADDLGIAIIAPIGAVFDEVKAAVGPEFHVHGPFEGHAGEYFFHFLDFFIVVK